MTSLNISLPEALREFVESQAVANGYGTPSEYIHALVRANQQRRAEEKLEGLLLEGLDSGEPLHVSDEYWEQKRARLIERHSLTQSNR